MKNLLLVFLLSLGFSLKAQVLFTDNAEKLPPINYTTYYDAAGKVKVYGGWWTVTAGTQNTAAQSPDCNITVSNKYARAGLASYRHYVRYTGNNNGPYGRSELGMLEPSQQTITNQWRWCAISTLIDPAHAFESRRYQIAYDHKEVPDNQETPFYLAILGDRYVLYGRFVDDPYVDLGQVQTGVWVDWLLERNWSTGNDGYMRFYKNGKQVWSRLNQPNISSGTSAICRIQQGFYKWAWYAGNPEGSGSGNTTGDLIMYSDEHKFGGPNATFAQMQPDGIVIPPPVDVPPTVSAGPDFYVPFGVAGILRGTVTGTATKKEWTSATTATFSAPTADQTNITTTIDGKFTAKLSAANGSANASDDAIVNVVKSNAGPDQTVDSGKVVTLTGTSTAGITITSGAWSRVSGNGGTLTGNTVTGLPPGVHVFRYTVTYPSTLAVSDDVQITINSVKPIPPPTKVPIRSEQWIENGVLKIKIYFSDGTSEVH